jgi:predicted O-methyltransferase YrrM
MSIVNRWQDIPSYEDPGEQIAALYEMMVRLAPPESGVLETGVYHGRSLVRMALSVKEAAKRLHVYGVDHFTDMSIGLEAEVRKHLGQFSVSEYVSLLKMDSLDAALTFPNESLWFVFLDGSHDREYVAAEVKAWMPKIKPGGFLAGHDYRWHLVAEPINSLLDTVFWEPEWPDIWLAPKQPVLDGDINLPTTIPKRASDPTIRQYFERKKF